MRKREKLFITALTVAVLLLLQALAGGSVTLTAPQRSPTGSGLSPDIPGFHRERSAALPPSATTRPETVSSAAPGGRGGNSVPAASPLVANISATPTVGYAPLTVAFAGSASGGTPPYDYSWEFVGYAISGQYTNQTFTSAGDYGVTLVVGDSASHFAQANVTIQILARPFSVQPTATPGRGLTPLNVSFQANPSGGSTPYSWNWYVNGASTPVTTENFSYTFSKTGVYSVELSAFASGGQQTATGEVNVTVGNSLPLAATLSVSPTLGVAPLTVTAIATATNDLPPYHFTWSLGDGSNATGPQVVHTFNRSGKYLVNVTVTDANGQSTNESEWVRVASAALRGTARAFPGTTTAGAPVQFTGTATGGFPPYSFAWSFGDGARSSTENVTHAYGSAGNYTVVFCVNDSASEMACGAHTIVITTASSSAGFIPGLSPIEGYGILGGAAGAVAALALVVIYRRRTPPARKAEPTDPPAMSPPAQP